MIVEEQRPDILYLDPYEFNAASSCQKGLFIVLCYLLVTLHTIAYISFPSLRIRLRCTTESGSISGANFTCFSVDTSGIQQKELGDPLYTQETNFVKKYGKFCSLQSSTTSYMWKQGHCLQGHCGKRRPRETQDWEDQDSIFFCFVLD